MALAGEVFAEHPPNVLDKKRNRQADFSEIACTEFGTLPRETIVRLGLRHVYTMPVVLENKTTTEVFVYQAEVLWQKKWRTVYVQEEEEPDEGWHKHGL